MTSTRNLMSTLHLRLRPHPNSKLTHETKRKIANAKNSVKVRKHTRRDPSISYASNTLPPAASTSAKDNFCATIIPCEVLTWQCARHWYHSRQTGQVHRWIPSFPWWSPYGVPSNPNGIPTNKHLFNENDTWGNFLIDVYDL